MAENETKITLEEMIYSELVELESRCDRIIEKFGGEADLFKSLKERAAAARYGICVDMCLQQFWRVKQQLIEEQKENN